MRERTASGPTIKIPRMSPLICQLRICVEGIDWRLFIAVAGHFLIDLLANTSASMISCARLLFDVRRAESGFCDTFANSEKTHTLIFARDAIRATQASKNEGRNKMVRFNTL